MNMEDAFTPSYEDLASAWWAISEALEIKKHPWKSDQQNRIFCEVLKQCGWTIEAWNDEVAFQKMISEETASPSSNDEEKGTGSQEK